MYKITKTFTFAACHHIPDHGKCGQKHGHTYEVDLVLRSAKLEPGGMVMDYGGISSIFRPYLEEHLDHKDLNEWLENPTAELIAMKIYQDHEGVIPHLSAVIVRESPTTSAEYTG
jgi:6-pyruvoyltetrahydropterin/6-carboxytetrahydropterin synthase